MAVAHALTAATYPRSGCTCFRTHSLLLRWHQPCLLLCEHLLWSMLLRSMLLRLMLLRLMLLRMMLLRSLLLLPALLQSCYTH